MTKLTDTPCRRCRGAGNIVVCDRLGANPHLETCAMCNGWGFERETVTGTRPVGTMPHHHEERN